jgi:hypothetical protein
MNHDTTRDPGSIHRSAEDRTSDTPSQRFPILAETLKQANVTRVRIEYDGQFDFGRIRDAVYLTGPGRLFDPILPTSMTSELHAFFGELLDLRFPRWANAEGARGEFEWNLVCDTLTHSHSLRYTDYETSTLKGL